MNTSEIYKLIIEVSNSNSSEDIIDIGLFDKLKTANEFVNKDSFKNLINFYSEQGIVFKGYHIRPVNIYVSWV